MQFNIWLYSQSEPALMDVRNFMITSNVLLLLLTHCLQITFHSLLKSRHEECGEWCLNLIHHRPGMSIACIMFQCSNIQLRYKNRSLTFSSKSCLVAIEWKLSNFIRFVYFRIPHSQFFSIYSIYSQYDQFIIKGETFI